MLSGYEKYGGFCDAVDVFEAMPEKNVMSYNVMLSGYLGIGDFMSAWKVFDEIGERNVASWNAMINGYVKVGRMREGCELFDEMSERNEVSYTIMISGRVGVSEFEEAWRWFVDMRRRGVMPDQNVFLVVFSVVIGLDNVVTLANLVTLAMKMGYSEDVVGTVILNAFTLEDAVALYIQVPEQTVETQTAMMIAYAQSGRIVEARKVFNDIRNPNVLSWNALLAGYMHNGMIEEAKELFKQMPTRNVASWAAMIPGVVHNGQSVESLELMAQMHRLGNIPSDSSFTSALLACANVGDVEVGRQIHSLSFKAGCQYNPYVGNGLITMYAKCKNLEDDVETLGLKRSDIISSPSIPAGHSYNFRLEDALVPPIYGFEDNYEERTNKIVETPLQVARKLMPECDTKKGKNSLLKADYDGWLLYTAASAGDLAFVQELLERSPLLEFGESEYGVTDISYAAARSKSCDLFRVLLDFAITLMFLVRDGGEMDKHIAEGATPLHAAAGKGQVEGEWMLRLITGRPGPSGFGSATTAEQVTGSNLTAIVTASQILKLLINKLYFCGQFRFSNRRKLEQDNSGVSKKDREVTNSLTSISCRTDLNSHDDC
ncbi:hypothetical protein T459_33544 [Capsicum annuum]|uniref:Uncharacterized protein n=1 Tax=Capsicum annuum TaxID=4072 RepID=A0A2G2XYJ2_CAPAN|nr:hypothetical protein T459_33544 [Capsicum annuum]